MEVRRKIARCKKRQKRCTGLEREETIERWKEARKELLRTPAKWQIDKKITYIRYADDFLIGINGNKADCEQLKQKLSDFIAQELQMELSQEKTLITHSSEPARFLGYDVRVRRDNQAIWSKERALTMRSLSNKVELTIPLTDKIEPFLFRHGVIQQRADGRLEPCKRPGLLYLTDLEIVSTYNAELRGICNYYNLACNFNKLNYFGYLMEYSCLKTLAGKHNSKISKIHRMYYAGQKRWGVPYETRKGTKRMLFAKYRECRSTVVTDQISHMARNHAHTTTSFESRLKAEVCEVCGSTGDGGYEIHHVNKVKDLKGKEQWEKIMIAKRRKTIVVCHKCHMAIHHGRKKE